jgi:hypothetical protein
MTADNTQQQDTARRDPDWPDWVPSEPPTFAFSEEFTAPQRALRKLGRYLRSKLQRRPAAMERDAS